MIDFFNPLQSVETGVLPVSIHGSISDANPATTNIADIKMPITSSFFDVVGPDSPPRPK
jgi:hypothetical protein